MRVADKIALVTAAAAGIGRATALAMAREGARVHATDIDTQALGNLARERSDIECFALDVLDADAIFRVADRLGRVDVLFNCAGYVHDGTVLESSRYVRVSGRGLPDVSCPPTRDKRRTT